MTKGKTRGDFIMFCKNCGAQIDDNAVVCTSCGVAVNDSFNNAQAGSKNKIVAGVLALLLGNLGVHNFYLGYTKKGLTQLLVSLLLSWTFIAPLAIFVWVIYEAIQIFTGKINDADGKPLV